MQPMGPAFIQGLPKSRQNVSEKHSMNPLPPHRISLNHTKLWKLLSSPDESQASLDRNADGTNESIVVRTECISIERYFNASPGLMEAKAVRLYVEASSPIIRLELNGKSLHAIETMPFKTSHLDSSVSKMFSLEREIGPLLKSRNRIVLTFPRRTALQTSAIPTLPTDTPTESLVDIFLEVHE